MSNYSYNKDRFGLADPPRTECIFCRIASGDIPSNTIAESDLALAFLDISPAVEGHTLVIPRAHSPNLLFADVLDIRETISLVQKVSLALIDVLNVEGVSVWQANGIAGGQTVPHTHFHVLPRRHSDVLRGPFPPPQKEQAPPVTLVDQLRRAAR